MSRTPRVMVVAGTRPEAIKVAPLITAARAHENLEVELVTTGQHREMLAQVLEVFGIRAGRSLEVMEGKRGLSPLASRVLAGMDDLLDAGTPDAVVVQGDTSTAFAAGLAAFHRGIPVVHLEAGLRSGDLSSPFPEEGNRQLLSRVASLHLAPTATSRANLLAEGIEPARIAVTGNTVIDALLAARAEAADREPGDLASALAAQRAGRPVLLVTTHRRENWGEPMHRIAAAVRRLTDEVGDLEVVLPMHANPDVRATLLPILADLDRVTLTEPLDYLSFVRAQDAATVVLTDSGGVQEEAPSLGKPVLVARENTERPEAVAAGTARLVGTDEDLIVREVMTLLSDAGAYQAMARAVNPYGDGHAARRGLAAIGELLEVDAREADFSPVGGTAADSDQRADRPAGRSAELPLTTP
ncbi:non-hydrolyzing UDP-N-acetylglucosamine 2-epimerase [Serinibacter salmoneus]|uniref:UDP-N-acetylglucosamine 2-epimerase (non-hydrolyzing) n=1 Tax=Serinibacter salmoneus TaxID=556530 RepID=A0A2A9CYA9_9MICO|nr:UDP-N-acetylglucosamine 2-epimerase (non-hydrolyzing) [Serinibacter salmoneus]PFG18662.1 UDP-N-acetylglucosamine 2-epimerase (non-hydrolysing) [Serinibacter salmoneus]